MAEILTDDPIPQMPPQPAASPILLGPNKDDLERALARLDRAAAVRRKAKDYPHPSQADQCLTKEQINELFQNCIKLASENKINQKNTWELKLIDHMSEIIRAENEDDGDTNFQKLHFGSRGKDILFTVDSLHSEAYMVLGAIIRAGGEEEQESQLEGDDTRNVPDGHHSKKEKERKISPLATLEPSFDALNAKKFDVAFAVDPLYQQRSVQFDEGRAKGLLLNNLGVYGGCQVLFDSLEVPSKCNSSSIQNPNPDMIDLSFIREDIKQMVINIPGTNDISPTLREIVSKFDGDNLRQSHALNERQRSPEIGASVSGGNIEMDGNSFMFEAGCCDSEEEASGVEENFSFGDTSFPGRFEEDHTYISYEPEIDGVYEDISVFFPQGSKRTTKRNAWAGPDHWKYQMPKCSEGVSGTQSSTSNTINRPKNNKHADLDFVKSLGETLPDIFATPKNPKLLLLPENRKPCDKQLPEDCHYHPKDLVKLFLRPNVMCLGKKRRELSNSSSMESNNNSDQQMPSWDNDDVLGGQYDDGCAHTDFEDSPELVAKPWRATKIEVQYEKASKQVDVRELKETLWDHIQESIKMPEKSQNGAISFKEILATFPDDPNSAVQKDISPHLCFVCLLHLANEHSLTIGDCATMDDLSIQLPFSSSGSE